MTAKSTDTKRRKFLTGMTTTVGMVGAAIATIPFIASMSPSERAKAAGAPVEVDISKLQYGQLLTVEWRGKPVWIIRRTQEMLDKLTSLREVVADPESERIEQQPQYATNNHRSIDPEVLIVIGICTHLGCAPVEKITPGSTSGLGNEWPGGFFCPCHGSKFDLAGRVYKDVPAPTNLAIPPHRYLSKTLIEIGVDPELTS